MISQAVRVLKKNTSLCILAGATAAAISLAAAPPARADLATAVDQVETAMGMLENIAETGVGIVIVPFGVSFALKIAGHVLRAGT
jgi:citrate lyase alpha subunit